MFFMERVDENDENNDGLEALKNPCPCALNKNISQ